MMKRIFKGLILVFSVIILSGCQKNFSKISYVEFLGVFNNLDGYVVVDKTLANEGIYKRSYEVGNSKYTFFYFEFDNEKEANSYLNRYYKNKKGNKFKEYDEYTIVRNLNDTIKIIKFDNVVIIGQGKKIFDWFEINKIFKEMGY